MLAELVQVGALDTLDRQVAAAMARRVRCTEPLAAVALAVASRAVQDGHVCADLSVLADTTAGESPDGTQVRWPSLSEWLAALDRSPLCGTEGQRAPLVRVGERVYLEHYFEHEVSLARSLRARARRVEVDTTALESLLEQLFPRSEALGTDVDWQLEAARMAATHRLAVITGGPGTGKTTVVARLLAVLAELAHRAGQPFHPVLLAPTGKAAARLEESLRSQWHALPTHDDLPRPMTIHRGLGVVPGVLSGFRHDVRRPLPADLVLVDEASMVDLSLMRRLLDAVPPRARLVLLGDPDQLVSVESGAVLSELVRAGEGASALAPCNVRLRHSYRFDDTKGIGALAHALRIGDGAGAIAALTGPAPEVELRERPQPGSLGALERELVAAYRPLCEARDPVTALDALDRFRLLCAHRRGPHGHEVLVQLIEQALARAGLLQPAEGAYRSRPVLVTTNDYDQGLFNGDQGVLLPDPVESDGRLWAWFRGPDGTLRRLSPGRLPTHETAWALTVHKSQGSELERVWTWLPPADSPLATRELLYTAVTRARSFVRVLAQPEEVATAASRPVRRWTGLAHAIGRTERQVQE